MQAPTPPTLTLLPAAPVAAARAPDARLVVARRAPDASLQFYGPVGEMFGGMGAAQFAAALEEVKDAKSVTLYVSSDGGDFFEGLAIYAQIARFAETHAFTVVVDGIAASAASVIAMAAPRIKMAPNARLMIHEAKAGGYGRARDIRSLLEAMDSANASMADIYAKRSGLSVQQILAFFANGDTYFSATEAVDLGFADEIEGQAPAAPRKAAAFSERHLAAARINAQLARERREAAGRDPSPGRPG